MNREKYFISYDRMRAGEHRNCACWIQWGLHGEYHIPFSEKPHFHCGTFPSNPLPLEDALRKAGKAWKKIGCLMFKSRLEVPDEWDGTIVPWDGITLEGVDYSNIPNLSLDWWPDFTSDANIERQAAIDKKKAKKKLKAESVRKWKESQI